MPSKSSRVERGTWKLPRSTWAFPLITAFLMLLAVATALA